MHLSTLNLAIPPEQVFTVKQIDRQGIHSRFLESLNPQESRKRVAKCIKSFESLRMINFFGVRRRRFLFGLASLLGYDLPRQVQHVLGENVDFTFFADFFLIVYSRLQPGAQKELVKRFYGLLDPSNDLETLFSELLIAVLYASSGGTVSFPDLGEENDTFEFLVEKSGRSLEVEVKTVSSLSGQPLSERMLDHIVDVLISALRSRKEFFANCLVTIGIAGRQNKINRDALRGSILKCVERLENPETLVSDGSVTISYGPFPGGNIRTAWLAASGIGKFRWYVTCPEPFILIAFEALEEFRIVDSIEERLGHAFGKFSRTRPAVTWLRLSDVVPPEFRAPNPLPGDMVLSDPSLHAKIKSYSARPMGCPTAIILSTGAIRSTSDASQMQLVSQLVSNSNQALEHNFFVPEKFPLLSRTLVPV